MLHISASEFFISEEFLIVTGMGEDSVDQRAVVSHYLPLCVDDCPHYKWCQLDTGKVKK